MIREAESILRESGQLETRSEPPAKIRAFERAMGGKGTDTTITVAGHVFPREQLHPRRRLVVLRGPHGPVRAR